MATHTKQLSLLLLVVFIVVTFLGSYNWYSNSRFKSRVKFIPRPRSQIDLHHPNTFKISYTNCSIPSGGYTSWNQGVVSVLKPVVPRNCSLLFAGDKDEVKRVKEKAKEAGKLSVYSSGEKVLLTRTRNCSWVRNEFSNNFYISREERDFPIAFTFVVYENPQQFFRLLKAIYRPHNVYCIHLDMKAKEYTKQYVANIVSCLHNVIVPKKILSVYWGHSSLMDAQMSCFSDLYDTRQAAPWKYIITLCGKELPLRTNREIVQTLKKLDGNSAIGAHSNPNGDRLTHRYALNDKGHNVPVGTRSEPVPHNLTVYKSMTYFAVTVNFVDFLLHNSTAIEFHKFMADASVPEEHFYATLYMVPGVPDGFKPSIQGLLPTVDDYIWLTGEKGGKNWTKFCSGKNVHSICIVGVGDLTRIKFERPGTLFHNKYFMEVDHIVMDCCEEGLVSRNKEEYRSDCTHDNS